MEQKEIKEEWREEFEVKVFDIGLVGGNNPPLNSPRSKVTSKMMTVKEWNFNIQAVEYWESLITISSPSFKRGIQEAVWEDCIHTPGLKNTMWSV